MLPKSVFASAATLILVMTFVGLAGAQDEVKESDVSPLTRRYHAYRQAETEPTFALAKVKALIAKIKPTKGEDTDVYASPAWTTMSTKEKFTYSMLHGEVEEQICDMMPWMVDEEHKVSSYLPYGRGDAWSDRQKNFLYAHRSEMVRLLRTTIRERQRVGVNLKAAIVNLHANELIPDLIKTYNRDHKDQDILTVLFLLMKDGRYKPFLDSITYKKLYGPDANYKSFVVANEANQKLTFDRAMGFYRSRVK